MLTALAIRDIVLIDRLTLHFSAGLTALTGETGGGKSILLDSLGLALGARADSGLVRRGATQGVVSATFEPQDRERLLAVLDEQGIAAEPDEPLVLRRVVKSDGGSRAYVNDQPVSVALMRRLGDLLVEIHGQHDDRGLLDSAGHRDLLDRYGGHHAEVAAMAEAYEAYDAARQALEDAEAALERARADEDWLRHALEEIDALAPEPGEEAALADERARMMQGARLADTLNDLHAELTADEGADARLRGVVRRLERLDDAARERLEPVMSALDKAAIEAAEGIAALERLQADLEYDPARADRVEERLFALRDLARKHRSSADDLPALRDDIAARLAAIDSGVEGLSDKTAAVESARRKLNDAMSALSEARKAAAGRLDAAVNAELPPLKLDKARFRTALTPRAPDGPMREGGEQVAFEVATNPGAGYGPLMRIASGGELARFILALKVSLSARLSADTLVFDEVDRGLGGATADAVGERLARLAAGAQTLVVTHSPQVAARADSHLRVEKAEHDGQTLTTVTPLDESARREEIARMLSGARITDEARAAADSLLKQTA